MMPACILIYNPDIRKNKREKKPNIQWIFQPTGKYYSGTATYSRDFTVGEERLSSEVEAFVSFEDVQEMAQVYVNGNDCGVVWVPPYRTRITPYLKKGKNTITVKVVNNWNNRIVGDARNGDKNPYTLTNAKTKFSKDTPLLSSGLMGKSQIRFFNK